MGETEIDDAATQSHSGDPRVTIAQTIRIKQIQIKQTSNSDKNINGAQQSADQQPGQANNCKIYFTVAAHFPDIFYTGNQMKSARLLGFICFLAFMTGCAHQPTTEGITKDITKDNAAATSSPKQSSNDSVKQGDTPTDAAATNNTSVESQQKTAEQNTNFPPPTPASFSGSPSQYCALRVLHMVNMAKNRDRGIERNHIHAMISNKVAPEGRAHEKDLANNAAFLAYEMPTLSRHTLQSVEQLRCEKFVRTNTERPAEALLDITPQLLACQNEFSPGAENAQCLSMVLFSDDLCKLFDRSCPANLPQTAANTEGFGSTTDTAPTAAVTSTSDCGCSRTFSQRARTILENNEITVDAFESLSRVDPIVEQLYAFNAEHREVPAKGVLLKVRPKYGNTITKYLNRSLPAHNLRAVLYENRYGQDLDTIALVPTGSDIDYLKLIKTHAPNYDLTSEKIIEKYAEWQEKYKLTLDGAGQDWLAANIGATDIDWDALAEEVYAFCPDVVEQGTGTLERLRDGMKKSRGLYLWWD